jgi:hypothetical protein
MDTLDYFKLPPTSARQVTARLDWAGSANLDLHWRHCVTFAAVGNNDGATANNPEVTSVPIPAGQCWMILVQMISGSSTVPTFARLRLTSP